MRNGESLSHIVQLLCVRIDRGIRQPKRPPPEYDKTWLPRPETFQNPENLHSPQKKIFDNISELQQRDSCNPISNESKKHS